MKENVLQLNKFVMFIKQIQENNTIKISNDVLKKIKKPLVDEIQSAFNEIQKFRTS